MNLGKGFVATLVVSGYAVAAMSGCCGWHGFNLKGGWSLECSPASSCQVCVPAEGAADVTVADGDGCGVCGGSDCSCATGGGQGCLGRGVLRQLGQAAGGERYNDRPHFQPVPTQPAFVPRLEPQPDGSLQPPLEPVPVGAASPHSAPGPGVAVPEPEVVPAPMPTPVSPAPMPPANGGWKPSGGSQSVGRGTSASWVFKPQASAGPEIEAQSRCSGGCDRERVVR